MCAVSWHSTAPHGGHSAASAKRVGRGATDHREHLGVGMLEHLADLVAEFRRPFVGAVGQRRADVGGGDRRHDLGCRTGGVVAAELDRENSSHPF